MQNAVDLAHARGLGQPNVGILSAVETINPNIPSTLDAAVLSKMAERGQVRGAVVDGPLAMDDAIDVDAARAKGIASLVAGYANVLIRAQSRSRNVLANELAFVARAEAARLARGRKASQVDEPRPRRSLAACPSALAPLYEYYRREGRAFDPEPAVAKATERRIWIL